MISRGEYKKQILAKLEDIDYDESTDIITYKGSSIPFEKAPLENLAIDWELIAYKHEGFWQCMDTLTDRIQLERVLSENPLPWMHK